MSKIVQEKFQVDYPYQDNDDAEKLDGTWITDVEARAKKNQPGREGLPGGDSNSRFMNNARFFNSLPPGTDIEDQEVCDIRKMGTNTAGNLGDELARGDRTQDVNKVSLRKGFDRKKLLSTDEYTRQHNDAFYWDARVGDDEGYVERNNMLDRL